MPIDVSEMPELSLPQKAKLHGICNITHDNLEQARPTLDVD